MTITGSLELRSPSTGISFAGLPSATLAGTGHIFFRNITNPPTQPQLIAPDGGLTIPAGLTVHGTFTQAGGGPIVNYGSIAVDEGNTPGTTVLGDGATLLFTNRGTVAANGYRAVLNGGTNFGTVASNHGSLVPNGVVNAGTITATSTASVTFQPLPGQTDPGSPGTVNANASTVTLNYADAPAVPTSSLAGITLANASTLRFLGGQLNNTGATLSIPAANRFEIGHDPAASYGRGTIVGGTISAQPGWIAATIPAHMNADLDGVTVNGRIDVGSGSTLFANNLAFGTTAGAISGSGTVVLTRSDTPTALTPMVAPAGIYVFGAVTVVGTVPLLDGIQVVSGTPTFTSTANVTADVTGAPNASYNFAIGTGGTLANQFNVSGTLDLSAAGDLLRIDKLSSTFLFGSYPVITAGQVVGTFDNVILPAGCSLQYTPTSVVVVAPLPEPATACLALPLLLITRRRRRRPPIAA